MSDALNEMLAELAAELAHRLPREIPATGDFTPLTVRGPIEVKTPRGTFRGKVELHILAMRADIQSDFSDKRLLSVRVSSKGGQGFVSRSCFHGTSADLLASLTTESNSPTQLCEAVEQLAIGLPVESDDSLWR
jgi:hypothetical protein